MPPAAVGSRRCSSKRCQLRGEVARLLLQPAQGDLEIGVGPPQARLSDFEPSLERVDLAAVVVDASLARLGRGEQVAVADRGRTFGRLDESIERSRLPGPVRAAIDEERSQ